MEPAVGGKSKVRSQIEEVKPSSVWRMGRTNRFSCDAAGGAPAGLLARRRRYGRADLVSCRAKPHHRMLFLIREVNMSNRWGCRTLTAKPRMDRKTVSAVAMVFFVIFFFTFCASAMYGQGRQSSAAEAGKGSGDVARGKYLVEGVAMCGECHTPRNSSGGLDRSRWLQGAPMQWGPAGGGPNWPLTAPRIGGNPPASDADMIKLLTTGIWTTGKSLRFPMMPFRMSAADAKAVVAYLKSLTPQN